MIRTLPAVLTLFLASFALAESPREANVRLWTAAIVGTAADVSSALDQGAEIDAKSEAIYALSGSTALHFAVERQQFDIVQLLIRRGADPSVGDGQGNSVLHLAARELAERYDRKRFDSRLFDYLLDTGVSLETTNDAGLTPLVQVAILAPTDARLIDHLVGRGATIDWFAAAALGRQERLAEILAEDKDALRRTTESGATALHLAIRAQQKAMVKYLVDAGADLNVADRSGHTPLHASLLAGSDDLEIMRFLLEHGSDVTAQDREGRTALHHAAVTGTVAEVQLLIAHKADVTTPANRGQTPLHWARTVEIAEALLAAGAPLNAKDAEQRTPLDIMEDWWQNPAVAKLLIERGAMR